MDPLFEALKALNKVAYDAARIASKRQAPEAGELRKLCRLTDKMVDDFKPATECA
jgi:hypothetical protein